MGLCAVAVTATKTAIDLFSKGFLLSVTAYSAVTGQYKKNKGRQ